eukprot:3909855-Prymnesium_polylepis.1
MPARFRAERPLTSNFNYGEARTSSFKIHPAFAASTLWHPRTRRARVWNESDKTNERDRPRQGCGVPHVYDSKREGRILTGREILHFWSSMFRRLSRGRPTRHGS